MLVFSTTSCKGRSQTCWGHTGTMRSPAAPSVPPPVGADSRGIFAAWAAVEGARSLGRACASTFLLTRAPCMGPSTLPDPHWFPPANQPYPYGGWQVQLVSSLPPVKCVGLLGKSSQATSHLLVNPLQHCRVGLAWRGTLRSYETVTTTIVRGRMLLSCTSLPRDRDVRHCNDYAGCMLMPLLFCCAALPSRKQVCRELVN